MIRRSVRSFVGLAQHRDAFACSEIRIKSYLAKQSAELDADDFLNSFYANDLAMIAERAHTGDVGVALATYLSEDDEIDESARIDVRRQLDSVYSRLAPDLMPAGRWVSPHELNVAAGKMAAAEGTCELWFAAQRHHHAVRPTFLDLILSWGRKTP
jgi:hypothetical protein